MSNSIGEKPKRQPQANSVTFSCGHARDSTYFAKRVCPACRFAKEAEESVARKAKKPKRRGFWRAPRKRLPHDAEFKVRYDAVTETWSGTLTIADRQFSDTAPAVFTLMYKLDRAARLQGAVP